MPSSRQRTVVLKAVRYVCATIAAGGAGVYCPGWSSATLPRDAGEPVFSPTPPQRDPRPAAERSVPLGGTPFVPLTRTECAAFADLARQLRW